MRYNVGDPSSTNTELQTKKVGTMKYTTFIGLDVHKDSISVAAADGKRNGEVRYLGTIPNNYEASSRLYLLFVCWAANWTPSLMEPSENGSITSSVYLTGSSSQSYITY